MNKNWYDIANDLHRKCTSIGNMDDGICKKNELSENPINVSSIFTAFHIRIAGHDIGKALGMMGVMG